MNEARHRVFILALVVQWFFVWIALSDEDGSVQMFLRGTLGDMIYNDFVWLPIYGIVFAVTAGIAYLVQIAVFEETAEQ